MLKTKNLATAVHVTTLHTVHVCILHLYIHVMYECMYTYVQLYECIDMYVMYCMYVCTSMYVRMYVVHFTGMYVCIFVDV